jgi:hypothetical protein
MYPFRMGQKGTEFRICITASMPKESLKITFGPAPAICAVRVFALTVTVICPIKLCTAVHLDMRGNGISHFVTSTFPLRNKSVILFVCWYFFSLVGCCFCPDFDQFRFSWIRIRIPNTNPSESNRCGSIRIHNTGIRCLFNPWIWIRDGKISRSGF